MSAKKLIGFFQVGIFITAVILLALRLFVFYPYTVVGTSMHPTLDNTDRTFVNKTFYTLKNVQRFDIVAIDMKDQQKRLVKRVIGLPGESIKYKDQNLYIDEKKVSDEFSNQTEDFSLIEVSGISKVPDGMVFVMGDNRPFSHDSRAADLGFIPLSSIEGKVEMRFYPLNKLTLF